MYRSSPFHNLTSHRARTTQVRSSSMDVRSVPASGKRPLAYNRPQKLASLLGSEAYKLQNDMHKCHFLRTPILTGPFPLYSVREAKERLLSEVQWTNRGANVSKTQRGIIEEATLSLEAYQGDAIDYALLPGSWKLEYTTAPDVSGVIDAQRLPLGLLKVGDIYQQFSTTDEAVCKNIINLSLPLLQDREGVRLTVTTRYDVMTPKRIALTFEKAKVSDVRISPILESLLAPAILPRGFPNMWLLQALREATVEVPLATPSQVIGSAAGVRGGEYLLTFLDEDVLIGRAFQGMFVFTRSTLL